MTKKEKRLKDLHEKLSFYENKLFRQMSYKESDETESIVSQIKEQVIMLNVAIEDLREKIEELET